MSNSKSIKDNLEKLYKLEIKDVVDVIKDIEINFDNLQNNPDKKKNKNDKEKILHSSNGKKVPLKSKNNIENITLEISKNVYEIPLNEIKPNPYQPRKYFDQNSLNELKDSIKSHELFTPILLKKYSTGYYIISGERRYRATKALNLPSIKAIILPINDNQMQEIALLENIQRQDLNSIEEARAFKSIIDRRNITHEELSHILNKSRTYITQALNLLKLPVTIQNYVLNGSLKMGHVRPLLTLPNDELKLNISHKAIKNNLTVRNVEHITKGYKLHLMPKKRKKIITEPQYKELEERLNDFFHCKILIRKKQLTFTFRDLPHLNRILQKMKKTDF